MCAIAKQIKKSLSTASREIKRKSNYFNWYQFEDENRKAVRRHIHNYMFRYSVNFEFKSFSKLFKNKYNKKYFGIKATYNELKKVANLKTSSLRIIFN
ncbi:hypothetical protein [Mycoplasma phocimorsus]|uniref:hypothetical protein n=1 Tax=Mycoplasma phocimorsus TaxID=3045839 RepID=UPI0024BFD5A6|nr:hypothetical protein [Mycoplasma phocimorsus]MDJ1647812.1 hypothetical protein [Mycoplasma phocimorsus]